MSNAEAARVDDRKSVTILIPHFQTLDAIKLCLRCLRRYTTHPCVVRVLDNGSKDDSKDYLRSVSWIDLVETGIPNDTWTAHYQALNRAVEDIRTEYFVVMHSDTYVHHMEWLQFLLSKINSGDYSVTGSHDQAIPVRGLWLWFRAYHNRHVREFTPGVPIIRSLCALYRTQPFRESSCKFYTERHEDITYAANARLVQNGYRILPLPATVLCNYMFHSSATTRISDGTYPRPSSKHLLKQAKYRRLPQTKAVWMDDSLDR